MAWLLRFSPRPSIAAEPGALDLLLSDLWDLGTTGLYQSDEGEVVAGFETEAEARVAAHRLTVDGAMALGPAEVEPAPSAVEAATAVGGPVAVERSIDGRPVRMLIQADGIFGHGAHPTTALALDLLLALPLAGKSVLDVGTGTGVLAVAAALAGAESVKAIDVDPRAVEVARANGDRNGVRIDCTTETIAQVRNGPRPRFDVVVINVLLPVHRQLAAEVLSALGPGASVVTAGYLEEQADDIVMSYRGRGSTSGTELVVDRRLTDGDWVAHRFGPPMPSAP